MIKVFVLALMVKLMMAREMVTALQVSELSCSIKHGRCTELQILQDIHRSKKTMSDAKFGIQPYSFYCFDSPKYKGHFYDANCSQ